MPSAAVSRCRRPLAWRAFASVLLLALPVAAGDGPEELAADALARFQKAQSDKSADALGECMRDFDSVYEKVDPKTVKKLHRAYGELFDIEVRQELREDGSSPAEDLIVVYQLAVGTVFDKPGGRELLLAALKKKHIKAWPEAEALFVEALGLRMVVAAELDEPGLELANIALLSGYLESAHVPVVRAAANGLGALSEHPLELRRAATEPLVRRLASLDAAAVKEKAKGKQQTAQDFLTAVEGSFRDALQVLTRQRLQRAEDWVAWFDDHGGEDTW